MPCLPAPGPITAELRAIFIVTVYRLINRFRVVLGLSGAKLSRKYLWSPAFRSLESVVHLSHQKCKFHGQTSLAGCSPWGCKESDTTERLTRSVVHSPAGWALPGNVSGMWSQALPQNFQNGRLLEQIPFHRECLWIVKAEKSLRSNIGREMIHSSRSSHMVRKV